MQYNRYLPTELSHEVAMRLFCLPCAGGSAAMYYHWRRFVPEHLEVVPIHLPGREQRIDEPPHTELRTLVCELADAIAPALDRPFAFVGHSLGAWTSFELTRELRRRNRPAPRLLIVAASAAPQRRRTAPPMHELPDAELVAEVARRFDGIPPVVRENEELLRWLLPALRADMRLLETYEYFDDLPLATDILAIGGADDRAVSVAEIADWRGHTSGRFSNRMLPGGHFFLFQESAQAQHPPVVVRLIVEQLDRNLDA